MENEVASQLKTLQLMDTMGIGEVGEMVEIRGRVARTVAAQWGAFVRNILLLAKKARKVESVDFSRVYYIVTLSVELPREAGVTGPGPKKRGSMVEERLVWNWRIRFDSSGASFILEECRRLFGLKLKQQMAARGEIAMQPVVVPGIQVVDCGSGHPGTGIPER